MEVKIIFDKDKSEERYFCGWGLSYLIGGKVLFDAGEKSEYVLNNIEMLGIDIKKIQKIVISHNHWNHLGAFWDLLKLNKNIEVFACSDFLKEFKSKISNYNFKLVEEFQQVAENIYTSGCFETHCKNDKISEQALMLETEKGISLLCGCSHPGILEFIARAREEFGKNKIYSILGGFHLIDKDKRFIRYIVEEIKKAGVGNVGPSHCTGFEAAQIFKKAYPEHFLDLKVGKCIEL